MPSGVSLLSAVLGNVFSIQIYDNEMTYANTAFGSFNGNRVRLYSARFSVRPLLYHHWLMDVSSQTRKPESLDAKPNQEETQRMLQLAHLALCFSVEACEVFAFGKTLQSPKLSPPCSSLTSSSAY